MVPVVHTITVCFRDLCLQLTPTNSTYLLHTRVGTVDTGQYFFKKVDARPSFFNAYSKVKRASEVRKI